MVGPKTAPPIGEKRRKRCCSLILFGFLLLSALGCQKENGIQERTYIDTDERTKPSESQAGIYSDPFILHNLVIATHNYESAYKSLPARFNAEYAPPEVYCTGKFKTEGKPLLSWRVFLLPYIEQEELFKQFKLDEPWDSPHNATLIPKMPFFYRAKNSKAPNGTTVFQAVIGPDSLMIPQTKCGLYDMRESTTKKQHYITRGYGRRFREVTDGTSNTILFVKTEDSRAVLWTKPDDFLPSESDPFNGLAINEGNIMVSLGDGAVAKLPRNLGAKNLLNAFGVSDGFAPPNPGFRSYSVPIPEHPEN